MTEFEDYLSSKEPDGVSPDKLRYIGKKAAAKFIEDKVPLNESLSELVKESSLNFEHIRRVVEFANNETFSQLFKLGYDKNVTFEMAGAPEVAQKASVSTDTEKRAFVGPAPKKYIPGQETAYLDDMFTKTANVGKVKALVAGGLPLSEAVKKAYPDYTPEQVQQFITMYKGRLEKTAEADFSEAEKAKEFLDLRQESQQLASDLVCLGDEFIIKLSSLEGLCKEASRSGNPPHIVAEAILAGKPSEGLLGVIKESVGDFADFESNMKLAFGGMIAPGNPVTGLTEDLESTSNKLVSTQGAIERVQMGMRELLSILKGPTPMGAASLFGSQGGQVPIGPPQALMAGPPMAGPPMAGPPELGPQSPQV